MDLVLNILYYCILFFGLCFVAEAGLKFAKRKLRSKPKN